MPAPVPARRADLTATSMSLEDRLDEIVLCANVPSPLSSVPFHRDIACLRRFFAAGFPVHLAIHRVDDAEPSHRDYTALHSHDVPEINIILPDTSGLDYHVQVGPRVHRITESTSLWIPPHVPHSANVISGSGYLVAVRLDSEGAR